MGRVFERTTDWGKDARVYKGVAKDDGGGLGGTSRLRRWQLCHQKVLAAEVAKIGAAVRRDVGSGDDGGDDNFDSDEGWLVMQEKACDGEKVGCCVGGWWSFNGGKNNGTTINRFALISNDAG
ncbi:hypothetical protein U1Q18_026407 [Sarracenia purpurea var. burkii]